MLQGLPREVEEYIINPEDTCTECGGELKVIGREIVRTEVEYQPAKLIVKQIIRQVAKCTQCGKGDSPATKNISRKLRSRMQSCPIPWQPHPLPRRSCTRSL